MGVTEKRHIDQERAESRRKQILDAAETCFGRSGFHGASMAEISKTAGMSAGHIYNYFDSKDAIIDAFVQRNVEHVSAIVRDLEQREDALQAMYDDIENSIHENLVPSTWRLPLEIYSEAGRNPRVATLLQAADLHARTEFRKLLKRGREKRGLSTIDAVLDGRVEAIFSFFQGLPLHALLNPTLSEAATVVAFRVALAPLLFNE